MIILHILVRNTTRIRGQFPTNQLKCFGDAFSSYSPRLRLDSRSHEPFALCTERGGNHCQSLRIYIAQSQPVSSFEELGTTIAYNYNKDIADVTY